MMPNATSPADTNARLVGPSEREVRAALRQHNPDAAADALRDTAKILAAIMDTVLDLPKNRRSELSRGADEIRAALFGAAGQGRAVPSEPVHIEGKGKILQSRGSGLGKRISVEEGGGRLDLYAEARPLESWAGPVAGAGEIEQRLHIPRSTLSNWQKRGAVIGLLRGERKLAYPLDQFVDARPIEGIARILAVAPNARSAWLWLRQPHGALDGKTPLELLRNGSGKLRVIGAAERDFS